MKNTGKTWNKKNDNMICLLKKSKDEKLYVNIKKMCTRRVRLKYL